MKPSLAAALALSFFGLAAGSTAASAFIKRPPTSYPNGYVVAESQFGNGTASGPVRQVANGWQVRLPSGSWIYCRRSCSETLRVETVDFWEAQKLLTHECGIFGCLELRYPR